MTENNDSIRIVADYQMMGEHEGRKWADIVFGDAKQRGLISAYAVQGVHPMPHGLQFVQFTLDVPLGFRFQERMTHTIAVKEAVAFVNEIVGDSDVEVRTVYGFKAEPVTLAPSVGKYEGLWVLENAKGWRWSLVKGGWVTEESGEFTSWTDTELEEEGFDEDHLDALATKHKMPANSPEHPHSPLLGEWVNINEA